jgi:hypothetical protein
MQVDTYMPKHIFPYFSKKREKLFTNNNNGGLFSFFHCKKSHLLFVSSINLPDVVIGLVLLENVLDLYLKLSNLNISKRTK